MELFWYVMTPIVIIIAVLTIVDVFRYRSGWAIAGWIALVVILPFVGAIIYWVVRKSPGGDVEQAYLLENERRMQNARKPVDGGF